LEAEVEAAEVVLRGRAVAVERVVSLLVHEGLNLLFIR
jgi:hypothetical protein